MRKKQTLTIEAKRDGSQEIVAVRSKSTIGECSIYVEGMDFKCPLCGTLVQSGERHQCSK